MKSKLYIYLIVDIADEIDINELKNHFSKFQSRPLKLSHFTPAYLNFTVPPVETEDELWFYGPEKMKVRTKVKFYSFGSITVRYKLEIDGSDYKEIFSKAQGIVNNRLVFSKKTTEITKKSRKLVEKELDIKTYSGFVEDYAILWIQDKYAAMTQDLRGEMAKFLRNENLTLSDYEQNEALRYSFSYTPDDLTVVDWDRAVTIGEKPDYDVWDVLEYANLQLLQLRYYESELDKRLKEIYGFAKGPRFPLLKFYRTHSLLRKTLRIFIDFTAIEKRINNFLRLTGDEYLARVYTAAAIRLNMKSTQESLKSRLIDTKELFEMLSAEASAFRTEILEIIIILLIALEIVFAFI